ncbi:hydroxyacylglutathione hydrolase-like protein isoform X5 [Equus quagga]|uniref:hydroxyacylglutathione hydrolase-like protein isoform X5 n=1 Tax=Equus quagga TaxID=89248 RepID=UPI001EE3679F|nr:hydroxyacylglutathione hydrolase-like protein isoform X5 [Equus quagga]
MKVKVIPVLEDNYMYLVIEEHTREAVAVDVAVPKRGPRAGQRRAGASVARAGRAGRRRAHLRADPQADARRGAAGDALSVAGCGPRLEGTAQQMYRSLAKTLGILPPETKVFCGHEHTLANLEFAQKVEPCNDHVRAKLSWAKRGVRAQVHRQGDPGRGPGGTLQRASELRARGRTAAATGPGSPGTAVGAPEHPPTEVSPVWTRRGARWHIPPPPTLRQSGPCPGGCPALETSTLVLPGSGRVGLLSGPV